MWEIGVGDQLLTFLYSLILGGIFCVFYDAFRALRKCGLNSYIAVFISDILFWIIAAFVTFIFLIARTNGEVRGYVLVAQLLGFVAFRFTISRFSFPLFKVIFGFILRVLKKISAGIAVFCSATERVLKFLGEFMQKIFKSAVQTLKKLLKSARKVLYTNENIKDSEYISNEGKTQA